MQTEWTHVENMVAIAELSKGPSYQGFMGKWPFMVGSRLKACHTLPVNWTEFFFVDKSAIKAVFNWRVHLETVFTATPHMSLVSQCVPAIWLEGRKIIWIPALIWRHLSVVCCCIWVVLCFYGFGHQYYLMSIFLERKYQLYPKWTSDVSATSVDRWLTSCTWYLHGCNN